MGVNIFLFIVFIKGIIMFFNFVIICYILGSDEGGNDLENVC